MPGLDEGADLVLNLVLKRLLPDRDADLQLILYTDNDISETSVFADFTEPVGNGYAAITLTDADWTVNAQQGTHVLKDFVASGGTIAGIYGAALVTQSAGGTRRAILYEPAAGAPIDIADGETFRVTITADG